MKHFLLSLLLTIGTVSSFAQMSATFTQTINTKCNGSDCNYTGPSILINEMMMSPTTFNGCLSGTYSAVCKGEWIELYNPNLCEPIDISCYYLGSNVYVPPTLPILPPEESQGVFIIPSGTIIPKGGFCLLRGENAAPVPSNLLVQNGGNVVEIVIPGNITDQGICVNTGTRLWFPDNGGWFGFYDRNGTPQDAVSWGNVLATNVTITCIPTSTGCSNSVTQLGSYDSFPSDRKTKVYNGTAPTGQSIRRSPDGGAWLTNQGATSPTPGNCNATCATAGSSSCDGTATVNVTGGATPYGYVWNDSEGQLTQTAVGLCAGTYQVKVKDANSVEQTFSVTIVDFVPTVSLTVIQDICNKGQTVSLTGSPTATTGQTGVYAGTGVTGANFSAATSGDGTFPLTYTFTDENGCTNNASSTINVHPQPVAAISGIDPNYCLSNQTITPTLSPTGGVLSGPGVSNNKFSILTAGVGTHTLKYVVTTQYGCADSTTVTVTVTGSTPPVFTIQDSICLNANPIALTGTPAGGVFSIGGQTITEFNPTVQGLGNHIIAYTIEDPINPVCMAQAIDSILVIDGPSVTSNILDYYCFGAADFSVVMTPSGGQLTGDTILIGDQLIISTATAGNYSISYEYTTPAGCHSSYSKNFTVGPELKVSYVTSQDCFQNVTMISKPATFSSYKWYNDNMDVIGTTNPYTGHVDNPGVQSFSLEATDSHNCKAFYTSMDSIVEGITASMFQIPNVITPNDDHINDFIYMPLMNNECIEYKVLILNRWGNLVFEASRANPIFVGKDMRGVSLTDGVYFYKIVSDDFDCESADFKPMCYGFITIVSKK